MPTGVPIKEAEEAAYKKAILDYLEDADFPTLTIAYKKLKLTKSVVQRWRTADPDFDKAIKSALARSLDTALDFCESKLMELISNGNVPVLIYFLKTRGRSRGFGPDRGWVSDKDSQLNTETRNASFDRASEQITATIERLNKSLPA